MTRRGWLIILAVVSIGIAVEIVARTMSPAKGTVMIVNDNDQPMEEVTLSYDGAQVALGHLRAGASVRASLSAGPLGPLVVGFRQVGNPLKTIEISDFDPAQNRRDRFMLVLTIKNGQVERMMEDAPATTPWEKLTDAVEGYIGSQTRMAP